MSQPPKKKTSNLDKIGFAVIGIVLIGGFIQSKFPQFAVDSSSKSSPSSSIGQEAKCIKASGQIWSQVILYQDGLCLSAYGLIAGGNGKRVYLSLSNGTSQWVSRDEAGQMFIKTDDPALIERSWIEIKQ